MFARVASPAKYDRWQLLLLYERTGQLERITEFIPDFTQKGQKLDISREDTPVMQSFLTNQTLFVNNPFNYPSFMDESSIGMAEVFGKHLATPVRVGAEAVGVLMVGRSIYWLLIWMNAMSSLHPTLAAQVAITVENRRLFSTAEGERARLRTILDTLPAGVLVLDPISLKPI